METEQIAGIESARSSLMDAIGSTNDMSQYKSTELREERSEPESTALNQTDDRSKSAGSETGTNEKETNPSLEMGINQTSDKTATNPTDSIGTRENARIRDLIDQNKKTVTERDDYKQRYEKTEAELRKIKDQQNYERVHKRKSNVKEPEKPGYSKDILRQLLSKARQEGDYSLLDQVEGELEKWRNYEIEQIRYEGKHNEELKNYNSQVQFYKNATLDKFKDLSNPNSKMSAEYAGIRGWIEKEMPDLLEYPVGEFIVAQIADWKTRADEASARLAAVEAEKNKKQQENESLKKSSLPLNSTTSSKAGKQPESSSIEDARASLLRGIESALPNRVL